MDENKISLVISEEGINKLIELILKNIELKQKTLEEIPIERLVQIMADNNIDLSWVASQESVDKLSRDVNGIKEDLSKLHSDIIYIKNNINSNEGNNNEEGDNNMGNNNGNITEPDESIQEPEKLPGYEITIINLNPEIIYCSVDNERVNDGDILSLIYNINPNYEGWKNQYHGFDITYEIYDSTETELLFTRTDSTIANVTLNSFLRGPQTINFEIHQDIHIKISTSNIK